MIDPRRHLLALGHMVLIFVCFMVYDFGDRGWHFDGAKASAKMDRAGVYDLSRARILTKVIGHVRSHYIDPNRVKARPMAVAAMRAVQQFVPEVTVIVDEKTPTRWLDVTVDGTTERFDLSRVRDLYELNWKLMDIFEFLGRSLPQTTNLEGIEYAAVNGALETLVCQAKIGVVFFDFDQHLIAEVPAALLDLLHRREEMVA